MVTTCNETNPPERPDNRQNAETEGAQQAARAAAPQTMGTWRSRLEQLLKLPESRIWYASTGAALAAALGLLMPWLWIDDHSSPHTMGELITFYPAHNDKWYLLRTTPLGTLAMLFAPIFATLFVVANAIKAIINEPSTSVAIAALLTTLTLAALTGEITDPDHARLGSIAIPLAGMSITLLANLATIGINAWVWAKGRGERADQASSGFEW